MTAQGMATSGLLMGTTGKDHPPVASTVRPERKPTQRLLSVQSGQSNTKHYWPARQCALSVTSVATALRGSSMGILKTRSGR